MDERALIAYLTRRCGAEGGALEVGSGDDAAVLSRSGAPLVLSVDACVEGVHFRFDWASPEDVGWRATMAALSDLAAMGARPVTLLSSWIIRKSTDDQTLKSIADGIASAADSVGICVAGGNVSNGDQLSITTTVVGETNEPLRRSGARPGDGVWVTGTLGAAALGMHAIARNMAAPRFAERWRRPVARIGEGLALAGVAKACADVSDGLIADLEHVCEASGAGAIVEAARLPLEPGHDALARALGLDPLELALAGGEDYELVFACDRVPPVPATRIGSFTPGGGVRVLDDRGRELALSRHGFVHGQ